MSTIPAYKDQQKPKLPRPKPAVSRYYLTEVGGCRPYIEVSANGVAAIYSWDLDMNCDEGFSYKKVASLGGEHAALLLMLANHLHEKNKCCHTNGKRYVNVPERRHYCSDCNRPVPLTCGRIDSGGMGPDLECGSEKFLIIVSEDKGTNRVTTRPAEACPSCLKEMEEEQRRLEQQNQSREQQRAKRQARRAAKAGGKLQEAEQPA